MNKKDSLGDRIKENYEFRCRPSLIRRMPVIMRIDGKAFHTYTRKMQKPFDPILIDLIAKTTLELCNKIQGAVFAYQQSDEISILLKDYDTLTTEAWFDYDLCKMCSVGASLATSIFDYVKFNICDEDYKRKILEYTKGKEYSIVEYMQIYTSPMTNFDCRAFNIPKEEVVNYFVWRQQDATRNSIQMAGRANFSQNELHGKDCLEIQEKLIVEKRINWNNYSTPEKRGIAVYKDTTGTAIIDRDIPVFTQDRNFIERFVSAKES